MSLKTLYRKRTVIWPFYFYTIIRTLSKTIYTITKIDMCNCVNSYKIDKLSYLSIYHIHFSEYLKLKKLL
ncbi:hypothetical protein CYQ82_12270 [Enterococcus faecium]|nr:hypothetical protein CYQ82_12270 [Enterococcus faecium]RXW96115.1 hypothetical protein CYQ58_12385 [Enterococcus faecium]TKN44582.1 hypothetical protein DVX05_12530 [Enterococcus faecium]TKN95219.1 hypothetical protein DV112_12390 [Enterococcus faecium]TKO77974.1 hypothetical protein DVY42_12395 [Enterococcus faecium]